MELPKINKKVSEKAERFAEREYEMDGYEREWLGKGYYHGYMDAIKEITHIVRGRQLKFEIAESSVGDERADEDFTILRHIEKLIEK